MTPMDQQSTALLYGFWAKTSGAAEQQDNFLTLYTRTSSPCRFYTNNVHTPTCTVDAPRNRALIIFTDSKTVIKNVLFLFFKRRASLKEDVHQTSYLRIRECHMPCSSRYPSPRSLTGQNRWSWSLSPRPCCNRAGSLAERRNKQTHTRYNEGCQLTIALSLSLSPLMDLNHVQREA